MQKRCFFAAAGTHLLLILILFVGPAFFSGNKVNDVEVITFEPMILTDRPFSGGGNPNAQPPPPAPPQPQPPRPQALVQPPKRQVEKVEPEPQKEIKTTKSDDAVETSPRKIKVSTTVVKRSQVVKSSQRPTPSQTTSSSSKEFTSAAQRIRQGASSSTKIEMSGPGGGGPAYANYAQYVKSKYTLAWNDPEEVSDEEATAKVRVTIASDGTVVSARIIQYSGNGAIDRSVQDALDRVPFIAPFPEGAKERERTYTLSFNLKAKRLLG
jgi:TonB family protein